MKHTNLITRRLLSLVLAVLMATTALIEPVAAVTAADNAPIKLDHSRITENLPEGNLVYFGTASTSLEEGSGYYTFPIYREGDLSGEATVELHSVDMSALYGSDYEFVVSGVEETGLGTTILESYMTAALETQKLLNEADELAAEDEIAAEDDSAEEETITEETATEMVPSGSALAQLKADATGEATRDTYETEINSGMEDILSSLVPRYVDSMEHSASLTVTFAPGEDEKWLAFRLLDDNVSEGTETFNFILTDCEGVEAYSVTSLSVAILDDEPLVQSVVSFTKARYDSENNIATVVISRAGAEYSLVDMRIFTSEDTAEADVNYDPIDETLTFMPYETEKEYHFYVGGGGYFTVCLSDFTGCSGGEHTKTKVHIADDVLLQDSGDETTSFEISVDGKSYTVEYVEGEYTGKIMDESYEPALEVGVYYFSLPTTDGGIFVYSSSQYTHNGKIKAKTLDCEYVEKSTQHESYGDIAFYHTSTWVTGKIWTTSTQVIPATYYQFVTPDWASFNSKGTNPAFRFHCATLDLDDWYYNAFQRTLHGSDTNTNAAIVLKNIQSTTTNRDVKLSVNAVDNGKNTTPKAYLRFYGIAAMYKSYQISVAEPASFKYLSGTGGYISVVPAQVEVRCGAQNGTIGASDPARYIYANQDSTQTNLVISIDTSNVNGSEGKFGNLVGYTLSIEPGGNDKKVVLSYPEDYISYLDNNVSKFGQSNVDAQKKKIKANLDTIPYDSYFINWIDSVQKAVIDSGSGYYQKIVLTPRFEYIDVSVQVVAPEGGLGGSFTDDTLKTVGTHTGYHAGDVLNLEAVCTENGYRVIGYQYSVDGGVHWNTVTDTDLLQLLPGNTKYMIRPALSENDNCIEIKFANETAAKINVIGAENRGLIEDSLLAEEQLDGRYILRLNTSGETAAEQMEPQVGQVYSIHLECFIQADGQVCYPVITDAFGNTYTTQTLHYVARQSAADNVLTVDYYCGGQPTEYTISGTLVHNTEPILQTGTDVNVEDEDVVTLGVDGYSVSMPLEASTVTDKRIMNSVVASTDSKGNFTLSGVKGFPGTKMTMLVTNGADNQVLEVTLGSEDERNVGRIELAYPADAPRVVSLNYYYDTAANNAKVDNSDNSVHIYDDTFNLQVVVDARGHNVTEVRFTVYSVDAVTGEEGTETVYEVAADDANPGVFTLSLAKMTERLHNGDRIRISLVTEVTTTIIDSVSKEEVTNTLECVYPPVETGIVFYIENELQMPKTYSTGETPAVDVPVLGAISSSTTSGVLTLSRTYWDEEKTGYSLVVNLNEVAWSTTTAGTVDKRASLDTFRSAVDDAAGTGQDEVHAQNINNQMATGESAGQTIDDLESFVRGQDEAVEKVARKNGSKFRSGMTHANQLKANILAMMTFDFVLNPETGEYVFCSGAVSIGCTVSYNKTWYTTFYGVPIYFNFDGYLQVDITVYYSTEKGRNAMTAGEFDDYSGNLAQRLEEAYEFVAHVAFGGKFSVGAGMCGVVGAGGAIGLKLQFAIPMSEDIASEYGVIVDIAGSLYADLLIFRLEVDVARVVMGFGIYKEASKVSFLGGILEDDLNLTANGVSAASESGALAESESYVSNRDYGMGTSDMSLFGSNGFVRATPEEVQRTVLLDDAAESTAPQIVELDNGKKIIFFLGNRGEEGALNTRALYYSVCEDGWWSEPQIVADDGTADASPAVIEKNGKVVVAWVDAERPYTESDTNIDKLNALGISMAIYEDGAMGEELTLVQDEFFNFAPQLNIVDDTLYCSYMKRDISEVLTDEGLLDFTATYSTMATISCDIPTRTKSDESYVVIRHPVLSDPLVMDYQSVTTTVGGENYMLATYTVDEDCDLNTSTDRELFLAITNLDTGDNYYPIALTSDQIDQSNPQLTDLNGTVYLTWFENGYLFTMLDVSHLLESFFNTEEVGDVYRNDTEKNWYRKTAEELGLSVDDTDAEGEMTYERSVYERAYNGSFRVEQTNFQASENANSSISDYVITSDGKDVYIFYTDFGSADINDYSMELYGVRYCTSDDGEELDGAESDYGFGKGVKITDYGKVIDEFDLYMTSENKISMVSNHYRRWIDGEGNLRQGANQLVEIEFAPAGSVVVEDDYISLPKRFVPGHTEFITFDVVNEGLIPTTGFDVTVAQVCRGEETVIFSQSYEESLNSGETFAMEVPWTIPADLYDAVIKVTVDEHDVEIPKPDEVTCTVPYEVNLTFSDTNVIVKDGEAVVTTTLTNVGGKTLDAATLVLEQMHGSDNSYCEVELPTLAAGESVELALPFNPGVDDFSSLGILELRMRVVSEGETVSTDYTKLHFTKPVVAEINGGADSIFVYRGLTSNLTTDAAPWAGIAGAVTYTTSDPTVAEVSSDGTVKGIGPGTATITAYYESGISDTIEVTVANYVPVVPVVPPAADEDEPESEENEQDVEILFADVAEGSYYEEAVRWAVTEGVTTGTSETTFSPDAACTRAQAVTFLWRSAGSPKAENDEMPFEDVAAESYYYDAVLWAVENGITVGTSATTFSPDATCTRAQIVTFLWRMTGEPGSDAAVSFADVAPDAYYYDAVLWAAEQNVTTGTSETTFAPNQTCTRAQIVTFLWRARG